MRIAALVLGLVGGIIGVISGFIVLTFGGLFGAFGASGAGTMMWMAVIALFSSVVGIVGGALGRSKPTAAGILMLIAAVGGLAIGGFWLVAGPLLLIGAILAFVAAIQSKPPKAQVSGGPGVPHPGM